VAQSVCYELTITGHPGRQVLAALVGFEIVSTAGGRTRLQGWVRDQAELQGLVRTLGELGVPIEGLEPVDGIA
jgi:hypothetical protein